MNKTKTTIYYALFALAFFMCFSFSQSASANVSAFEPQTPIVKEWGYNSNGQLGFGNTTDITTPQTVSGFSDITAFGGGYFHSVALRADGTVITAGSDTFGQLGDGTIGGGNRTTFGAVVGGNVVNIKQVSGGDYHNLALRADGTVWAWGAGTNGQLGNGANVNSATPVQVGAGIAAFNTRVVAVSAGFSFNLALTDDGKVWAWGADAFGQLGNGTTTGSNVPIPVLSSMSGAQLSGIVQISAGERHSVALKNDGTTLVWGYNAEGQVGNGTINREGCFCVNYPTQTTATLMGTVAQVSAGMHHTVAVNTNGDVYAWGQGVFGQIGDGSTADALTPRKTSTVANVVRIESHGAAHNLALRRDGTLFVWGFNPFGQIGNGTTTQQNTPLNISAPAETGGNLGTNIIVFGTGVFHSFALILPQISNPTGAGAAGDDEFSVSFPLRRKPE